MKVQLYTAPVIEPLTLSQLKEHLRLDSSSLSGDITTTQSILPGSHGVSAGGAYTHEGAAVSVIGKRTIVNLNAGTVGAGGTVDAKIQESDNGTTWADWTGGAFTQVTASNDNAIQEKAYTGAKAYVRVVAKVLVAACEFGADVITESGEVAEDDLLTGIIQASREHVEDLTSRALLTQTWDYFLDEWPAGNAIRLPFGNLQNGGGVEPIVSWKDQDGTETVLTVGTDYIVETNGEGCGRIVLPSSGSWPSGSLYPSNPIKVRFVCGWTAAALIPQKIISAVKLIAHDLYENREGQVLGTNDFKENKAVKALLASARIPWEF